MPREGEGRKVAGEWGSHREVRKEEASDHPFCGPLLQAAKSDLPCQLARFSTGLRGRVVAQIQACPPALPELRMVEEGKH